MARRSAVKKAKGDYYIFLDSDDYWDNDLLQTVNKTIEETGCDIVIFKFRKLFKNRSLEQTAIFEDGSVFDSKNKEKLFKKIIVSSALNNFVCKAVSEAYPTIPIIFPIVPLSTVRI
jgi:glycosyltransferase involved in cell wall biosynthesis